jgi:hypothetical protein
LGKPRYHDADVPASGESLGDFLLWLGQLREES